MFMFNQIFIKNYIIYRLLIYLILTHHGQSYTFLFSVIISIYNTGRYLNDSIGSLINQSISFEDNIQIILVNDRSSDNIEEI